MNQSQLSKADLMFLALVSSGKIKLEDIGPEQLAIARNLMLLEEVYSTVKRQVAEIEKGEDPVRKIEESVNV